MKNKVCLMVLFKAEDLEAAITVVKDLEYTHVTAGNVSLVDAECPGYYKATLFTRKRSKEGFVFYGSTEEDYKALYSRDKETGMNFYDMTIVSDVVDLNTIPDYVWVNSEAEEVGSFVDSRRLFKEFNHENKHHIKNIDLLLEVLHTSYNKYYVTIVEATKLEQETYDVVLDDDVVVTYTREEILDSLTEEQLEELIQKGTIIWTDADNEEHKIKLVNKEEE